MNSKDKKKHLVFYKGDLCLDCGKSFPNCCYDFDHRDPIIKSFNISENMSKSLIELEIEADKCDLLCSNCHRIRNTTVLGLKAAKAKGRRLGRKPTEFNREKWLMFRSQGLSNRACARKLGISESILRRLLVKEKLRGGSLINSKL